MTHNSSFYSALAFLYPSRDELNVFDRVFCKTPNEGPHFRFYSDFDWYVIVVVSLVVASFLAHFFLLYLARVLVHVLVDTIATVAFFAQFLSFL